MNPDEVIKEKFNKLAVSEQAGELLFKHEDALKVIEEIEKLQIIILGLDFWKSVDNDYMEINSTAWDDINSGENASSLTVQAAKRLLKNGLPDNADFVSFVLGTWERFFCPCCGYKTLEEKPPGTYDICSICSWEDDDIQFDDPNYRGGANHKSLLEARVNLKESRTVEKSLLKYDRKLARNTDWKSLGYPQDIRYDGLCPIIFRGDEKAFNEMIDKIDIDEKDPKQINYLQYAITYKQDKMAKKLIQRNIDLNSRDDKDRTPLLYAAENKNFEIAKLILEKGGEVDLADNWGNTPLWYAAFGDAKGKDYNLVGLLIKAGADPEHVNKAGTTPIYLAKNVKDEKLLSLLTSKKLN